MALPPSMVLLLFPFTNILIAILGWQDLWWCNCLPYKGVPTVLPSVMCLLQTSVYNHRLLFTFQHQKLVVASVVWYLTLIQAVAELLVTTREGFLQPSGPTPCPPFLQHRASIFPGNLSGNETG